jgi:NRE family putative nickel resistance protein-like MFS transporter
LVNSVGHIKGTLHLDDKHYGWVMAAFGIGASIAAFVAGSVDKTKTRQLSLISGTLVLAITISIT